MPESLQGNQSSQVSLSSWADFLLSAHLVLSTPAQCAWAPDATQALNPSPTETVSLLPPDISRNWEGGGCWAEVRPQQSSRGRRQLATSQPTWKKDPPGTLPAILHLNIQAFSLSTLSMLPLEISYYWRESQKSSALSWAWHWLPQMLLRNRRKEKSWKQNLWQAILMPTPHIHLFLLIPSLFTYMTSASET